VPADVIFHAKPEQAMAMLEDAWQAGVPTRAKLYELELGWVVDELTRRQVPII
jgi:hypothetical protein